MMISIVNHIESGVTYDKKPTGHTYEGVCGWGMLIEGVAFTLTEVGRPTDCGWPHSLPGFWITYVEMEPSNYIHSCSLLFDGGYNMTGCFKLQVVLTSQP